MINNKNKYSLLRAKCILEILDGDTTFGELNISDDERTINISLPYLSGPTLCEISNKFGMSVTYSQNGGALSRWQYMDNLLKNCIDNNRVDDLLKFLFSKGQFNKSFKGYDIEIIESAYKTICEKVLNQINAELCFGGNELVILGGKFIVKEIGVHVTVETPTIKIINSEYITELSQRALKDIFDGHYDSAITKSRTLLEEVFCFVIEKKGETPSAKGDIGKLYGQVKQLYKMHQTKEADVRINMLLSGLEKILSSIAEMRNANSDAHGVGTRRININDYHARLFVNTSTTMAEFILSVSENNLEM